MFIMKSKYYRRDKVWVFAIEIPYTGDVMKDFQWLHFSDLHLKSVEGFVEGRIRQELIQCLKQEDFKKNQNLYVFITGDIVNQNGYDANQDIWIEEFVNTLGVDKDRIFWSAGNHDIRRKNSYARIIKSIREKSLTLDQLRREMEEEEKNGEGDDSDFNQLTKKRLEAYVSHYDRWFDRKITEQELNDLHQFYDLEDFQLIVINTAITSCDNKDERNLFLCSRELNSVMNQADRNKPLFVMGHHGLCFLEKEEQAEVEKLFDSSYVDVYLCGHAHEPGIRRMDHAGNDIQEITSGGGIPDQYSVFTFLYGECDSSTCRYHLTPYTYRGGRGGSGRWEKDPAVGRRFRDDKWYDLACFRNLQSHGEAESQKNVKSEEVNTPVLDLNCLAWQIPEEWDPDLDMAVPLNDKNVISLPALLLGRQERFTLFLASTIPEGLAKGLQHQSEQYMEISRTTGLQWQAPVWREYSLNDVFKTGEQGNFGRIVNISSEQMLIGNLGILLKQRMEERDNQPLIINIWSESPYFAARCAQTAMRNLIDIEKAQVLVVADMKQTIRTENEDTIRAVDQIVETYNKTDPPAEEEVLGLLDHRNRYPSQWGLLLKRHALKRNDPGWIRGFLAAAGIHEHVIQWLRAVKPEKLVVQNTLNPELHSIDKEDLEDLTWETYLLLTREPSPARNNLLNLLLEWVPESLRCAINVMEHIQDSDAMENVAYPDIARLGHAACREDYRHLFQCMKGNPVKQWVLSLNSPYGLEGVICFMNDTYRKDMVRHILCQDRSLTGDIYMQENVDYIRSLVYTNDK